MQDDRKLDMIREEAQRQEQELIQLREEVREQYRDADFEDEQMGNRIIKQERVYGKQIKAEEQKLEIVKLGQEKCKEEKERLEAQLERRREGH